MPRRKGRRRSHLLPLRMTVTTWWLRLSVLISFRPPSQYIPPSLPLESWWSPFHFLSPCHPIFCHRRSAKGSPGHMRCQVLALLEMVVAKPTWCKDQVWDWICHHHHLVVDADNDAFNGHYTNLQCQTSFVLCSFDISTPACLHHFHQSIFFMDCFFIM